MTWPLVSAVAIPLGLQARALGIHLFPADLPAGDGDAAGAGSDGQAPGLTA